LRKNPNTEERKEPSLCWKKALVSDFVEEEHTWTENKPCDIESIFGIIFATQRSSGLRL
jgi:hypothetical protein